MSRPTVLMPAPMPAIVENGCDEQFDVLRPDDSGLDPLLKRHADRIRGLVVGGHVPVDAALLDRLGKLEIVSTQGVGYEQIDADAAAEHGVVVTNTPGVLDDEVADTTVALLLMTVRRLGAAERFLRAGRFEHGDFPLSPGSLRGRRVGILGMGRIGQAIATRLVSFGLPIAYHTRSVKDVPYEYYDDATALARAVDTLIVIVPGGDSTRHLVDADVLAALGRDGVLINVARGSVVDERALVTAVREHTIMGAGLDVYEHEPKVPQELIESDDVVLLPHVGSASVATRNAMGQLVVDNLVAWFTDRTAITPVPETVSLLDR